MSSPKKTGTGKQAQKKHVCFCGKYAQPVLVMPGRKVRFQCERGHRSERRQVTLAVPV